MANMEASASGVHTPQSGAAVDDRWSDSCAADARDGAAPHFAGASPEPGTQGETTRKKRLTEMVVKPVRVRPMPALRRNLPEWQCAAPAAHSHVDGQAPEDAGDSEKESGSSSPLFWGASTGPRFRVSVAASQKFVDQSDVVPGASCVAAREATTTASDAEHEGFKGEETKERQPPSPGFLPPGRAASFLPASLHNKLDKPDVCQQKDRSASTRSCRFFFPSRRTSLFCIRQTLRLLRLMRFLWTTLARLLLPLSVVEVVEAQARRAVSVIAARKTRDKHTKKASCCPHPPSLSSSYTSAFASSRASLASDFDNAAKQGEQPGRTEGREDRLGESDAPDEEGETDFLCLPADEVLTRAAEAWERLSPLVSFSLPSAAVSAPNQLPKRHFFAWLPDSVFSGKWTLPESDEWRLSLFGAAEERRMHRAASPAVSCLRGGGEPPEETDTAEAGGAAYGAGGDRQGEPQGRSVLSVCSVLLSAVAAVKRKAARTYEAAVSRISQDVAEQTKRTFDKFNSMREALLRFLALLRELEGKTRQVLNESLSASSLSRFFFEMRFYLSRKVDPTQVENELGTSLEETEEEDREDEGDLSEEEDRSGENVRREQSIFERIREACDRAQTWHLEAFDLARTVVSESCTKLRSEVKRAVGDGRALLSAICALICELLRSPVKSFQVLVAVPQSACS
ncbi:hypothetical protein TGVAND_295650 [Toxoplasma gondii VAND]|uniref:Uncharacterized protein n=1 Tax=Toxoplasma gondii VAND TaxID=933077 RepID=A0A086PJ43_TOXGO|nr:hypothetical protein TGVAND_295650 [Toxoplasma gondii VAND]